MERRIGEWRGEGKKSEEGGLRNEQRRGLAPTPPFRVEKIDGVRTRSKILTVGTAELTRFQPPRLGKGDISSSSRI